VVSSLLAELRSKPAERWLPALLLPRLLLTAVTWCARLLGHALDPSTSPHNLTGSAKISTADPPASPWPSPPRCWWPPPPGSPAKPSPSPSTPPGPPLSPRCKVSLRGIPSFLQTVDSNRIARMSTLRHTSD
jgi:hypothetical protein